MFAVVETGGKQYKVEVGQYVEVEKLENNVGDKINLNVLLLSDGENVKTGNPYVEGCTVEAEVVEQGVVSLGCKVTVLDLEDNSEDTFQIVGSQEANPMAGKISDESPVGRGLIGHKEGETVVAKAPAGEMMFRVVKVEHN